jgi:hypothetical protein
VTCDRRIDLIATVIIKGTKWIGAKRDDSADYLTLLQYIGNDNDGSRDKADTNKIVVAIVPFLFRTDNKLRRWHIQCFLEIR